ncbi:hypothetical protein SAMN05660831_02065 [Thiohalospira halophila DSM 15071]|uniref:Uncharacterized protein n=1 Tax=Thiohalospira halophila DSM 15071 TaxID=1123397 RepID=A0A1I1UBX8_9GAMM|nr:hypothetical protein [Thiohalospira halophila]SFD67068.1 hypothetical protein SAMN05660831_02065 [Thiohalospira halophila DSM 15071]
MNWPVHNLIGHPAMQLLRWAGARELAQRVHDGTLPEEERAVFCSWQEGAELIFGTSCGREFWTEDARPTEMGMRHCPFCGRPLVEAETPPEECGTDVSWGRDEEVA